MTPDEFMETMLDAFPDATEGQVNGQVVVYTNLKVSADGIYVDLDDESLSRSELALAAGALSSSEAAMMAGALHGGRISAERRIAEKNPEPGVRICKRCGPQPSSDFRKKGFRAGHQVFDYLCTTCRKAEAKSHYLPSGQR